MALRWTAAGMLETEQQFRRIIGYRELAILAVAITKFHDERDILVRLHVVAASDVATTGERHCEHNGYDGRGARPRTTSSAW